MQWPTLFSFPMELSTLDVADPLGTAPGVTAAAAAAWPAVNRIIYMPFRVPQPLVVAQLYCYNDATVSGNLDLGIYSPDGTLIVNKGSTAMAGASALQLLDITDTVLGIGFYYLAMTVDNTTATFNRYAPLLPVLQAAGVLSQTPGSFGLPATATFIAGADAYLPSCGLAMVVTL